MKPHSFVRKHTESAGTASHTTTGPEGMHIEESYSVYDCAYCGEDGIATHADHDLWETTAEVVHGHIRSEHPEMLSEEYE